MVPASLAARDYRLGDLLVRNSRKRCLTPIGTLTSWAADDCNDYAASMLRDIQTAWAAWTTDEFLTRVREEAASSVGLYRRTYDGEAVKMKFSFSGYDHMTSYSKKSFPALMSCLAEPKVSATTAPQQSLHALYHYAVDPGWDPQNWKPDRQRVGYLPCYSTRCSTTRFRDVVHEAPVRGTEGHHGKLSYVMHQALPTSLASLHLVQICYTLQAIPGKKKWAMGNKRLYIITDVLVASPVPTKQHLNASSSASDPIPVHTPELSRDDQQPSKQGELYSRCTRLCITFFVLLLEGFSHMPNEACVMLDASPSIGTLFVALNSSSLHKRGACMHRRIKGGRLPRDWGGV